MEGFAFHGSPLKWLFAGVFCLLLLGCTEQKTKQVGNEYLKSEEYSEFKKNTDTEIKEKSVERTIESEIQQLSDCLSSNQLGSSIELSVQKVDQLAADVSSECTIEIKQNKLQLIAQSQFRNQRIGWVLLDRQRAYRDDELLVAVFEDESLKSFQSIGIFKKNPSEEIYSDIEGSMRGSSFRIQIRTNRNIFYPIEQQNITRAEVEINAEGQIREL